MSRLLLSYRGAGPWPAAAGAEALGPLHGYGIARRIGQISEDVLQLNQGTLYPALLRMEQEGWIASKWGASDNNRKARFYSITAAGRRRLAKETEDWRRMSSTIERFLGSLADALLFGRGWA